MSNLLDFLSDPASGAAPTAIEGIVTRAPASTSDLLHVALPAFDDEQEFGPCVWTPNGSELPVVGQRVLVLISDQQAPWAIPAWQTY